MDGVVGKPGSLSTRDAGSSNTTHYIGVLFALLSSDRRYTGFAFADRAARYASHGEACVCEMVSFSGHAPLLRVRENVLLSGHSPPAGRVLSGERAPARRSL
jgi:hypothetical protein